MKSNYQELEQKAKRMVRTKLDENINLLKKPNENSRIKISTNQIKEEISSFIGVFGVLGIVFLMFLYVMFYGYPF